MGWSGVRPSKCEISVSLAKASDRQVSEVHVAGGKVSLVISIVGPPREGNLVGVPTFQIDTDR